MHSKVISAVAFSLVCALGVLGLPGCGGCQPDDPETAKKKAEEKKKKEEEEKKKKPKPNFQTLKMRIEPSTEKSSINGVKPGHWAAASQLARANNFDFRGDLRTGIADRDGDEMGLKGMPFAVESSRPISLAKGKAKSLDTTYFIPNEAIATPWLGSSLRGRAGNEVFRHTVPTTVMPPHRYRIFVLASVSTAYDHLKNRHSIRPPLGTFEKDYETFYEIVNPKITSSVSLPSHALLWTTIAYVIWDDIDPDVLSNDQQRAMIDWLHWGGQIVFSGPGTLDRLNGSFIADYLPATGGKTIGLSESAVAPLNRVFSPVAGGRTSGGDLIMDEEKPVSAIELQLAADSQFVPTTGKLVAERRVGRGRVAVTAIPLTSRTFLDWKCFDGFLNTVLLRRPPRRFSMGETGYLSDGEALLGPRVDWDTKQYRGDLLDARVVSSLRFISRDTPALGDREVAGNRDPAEVAWTPSDLAETDRGFVADADAGVAGWDDFSGVADASRETLKQAAGIEVPDASFVVRVLAVYLVILVPVNWVLFRSMGRVEWAWVAAPMIAILGAVAVVRLAHLNIGFARSRTEVAMLEMQGGYARGHLSRFTAVYTSLSTTYNFHFSDQSAQALPFAIQRDFQPLIGQQLHTVRLRTDASVELRGFPVDSNSTGMIHSEQLIDVGGSIGFAGNEVKNSSKLSLKDVGLIRRVGDRESGHVEVAWIGDLSAGESNSVRFEPPTSQRALMQQWSESPTMAARQGGGDIKLWRVLDQVRDPRRFAVGDVRLIGWTDESLPGLTITPSASQDTIRTLIVVNLRYGDWPDPKPDRNSYDSVDKRDMGFR